MFPREFLEKLRSDIAELRTPQEWSKLRSREEKIEYVQLVIAEASLEWGIDLSLATRELRTVVTEAARTSARWSLAHLVVSGVLTFATLGLFGATCALVRATRDLSAAPPVPAASEEGPESRAR